MRAYVINIMVVLIIFPVILQTDINVIQKIAYMQHNQKYGCIICKIYF